MDSEENSLDQQKNPFYIDHGRQETNSAAHLVSSRARDKSSRNKQNSSVLIIGVGNECRSDDAVGLLLGRMLAVQMNPNIDVIEMSGEGGALMERWKNAEAVIIIDAVHSGASPGGIHRLDPIRDKVPRELFSYSTHAFGVAEAVELSRELGQLPPYMIIFGIEGAKFDHGFVLSPEVQNTIPLVMDKILAEVESSCEIKENIVIRIAGNL